MQNVKLLMVSALLLFVPIGFDHGESHALRPTYALEEGEGPTHILARAGYSTFSCLSVLMDENGLTEEMLPYLEIGRRIVIPAACDDELPLSEAARSEAILERERSRLGFEEPIEITAEDDGGYVEDPIAVLEGEIAQLIHKLNEAQSSQIRAESANKTELAAKGLEIAKLKANIDQGKAELAELRWNNWFYSIVAFFAGVGLIFFLRRFSGRMTGTIHEEAAPDTIEATAAGTDGLADVDVVFDERHYRCRVASQHRGKEMSEVTTYLWCPLSHCWERKILPKNMQNHLANHKKMGTLEVLLEASAVSLASPSDSAA